MVMQLKHGTRLHSIFKQEAFEKCWAHSPQRAASRQFTRCRHCILSYAACASMSTTPTTTTTTTRDRGDRYIWPHGMGPIIKLHFVLCWIHRLLESLKLFFFLVDRLLLWGNGTVQLLRHLTGCVRGGEYTDLGFRRDLSHEYLMIDRRYGFGMVPGHLAGFLQSYIHKITAGFYSYRITCSLFWPCPAGDVNLLFVAAVSWSSFRLIFSARCNIYRVRQ